MKHTTYVTACAKCGKQIATQETSGVCPHCGVAYEIVWQYSAGNK